MPQLIVSTSVLAVSFFFITLLLLQKRFFSYISTSLNPNIYYISVVFNIGVLNKDELIVNKASGNDFLEYPNVYKSILSSKYLRNSLVGYFFNIQQLIKLSDIKPN